MESANDIIEHEASDSPRRKIDTGGRWHPTQARETDGNIDVAPEGKGVATGEEVQWDGSKATDTDKPEHIRVPVRWKMRTERGRREISGKTYGAPGLNNRFGPIPPQIKEAVAKERLEGQVKPSF